MLSLLFHGKIPQQCRFIAKVAKRISLKDLVIICLTQTFSEGSFEYNTTYPKRKDRFSTFYKIGTFHNYICFHSISNSIKGSKLLAFEASKYFIFIYHGEHLIYEHSSNIITLLYTISFATPQTLHKYQVSHIPVHDSANSAPLHALLRV